LDGWHAAKAAHAPRIDYAPSEFRTKPWLTEAQIEGWFPHFAEEHDCFDAAGTIDTITKTPTAAPPDHFPCAPVGLMVPTLSTVT
jgi:hypothetical protein